MRYSLNKLVTWHDNCLVQENKERHSMKADDKCYKKSATHINNCGIGEGKRAEP